LSLLIIISASKTNKISRNPILLSHAALFKQNACFRHSNFFKVKNLEQYSSLTQEERKASKKKNSFSSAHSLNEWTRRVEFCNPTTSFLTATNLISIDFSYRYENFDYFLKLKEIFFFNLSLFSQWTFFFPLKRKVWLQIPFILKEGIFYHSKSS